MGYGPELPEFPIKVGQKVVCDNSTLGDMIISALDISEGGIWLHTIPCGSDGLPGQIRNGNLILLGGEGNVYNSQDEMEKAHEYFFKTGSGLPGCFFSLDPSTRKNTEQPPVPYFTPQSTSVLSTWYFGTVELAPERPGNLPYKNPAELVAEASDKFIWAEDKESGQEFFCMLGHWNAVSDVCNHATNCSFYFPYTFYPINYGFDDNLSPWIARARPKRGNRGGAGK